MASYVKGFMALFVVLTVLLHLSPGESYRKYIRFFSEFILMLALISPVLSLLGDDEELLNLVDYEAFQAELSAVSEDTQHIEYLYNEKHRAVYEQVIAEDVKKMAEGCGFLVQEIDVELSEEYTIDSVSLVVIEGEDERQVRIRRIDVSGDEAGSDNDAAFAELEQELMKYYALDESRIEIRYGNG